MHSLVFGVQKLFANTNNGDTAYLLIGGRGKNDGYKQALSSICKLAAEKSVYIQWLCFGESASELYNALPDSDHSVKTKHATMRQAVEKAFENRAQREFVLLSPGCASFDEFANFEERGKMFEKIVREMRK
jgi:UDP-N-acetylmuramoylalanine--D-glutamate ligase